MWFRRVVISILIYSISNTYAQQAIPFAQHVFNANGINPAYSGYKEVWSGQVGVRSQWSGIKGAPRAGYVAVDGILDPQIGRKGGGLILSYDKIGVQSATSMFANYALRLQIDDEDTQRLSIGVSAGFTQYSLNGSELIYIDEGDPNIPDGMITTMRPDMRLGVFYHTPSWYFGVSVHDLFSRSDSREDFVFNQNALEGLYRNTHGYLMVGAAFGVGEGVVLRPSVLIKDDFVGPTALDVNAMLIFDDKFWVGGAFRSRSKIFDRAYDDVAISKFSSYKSIGLLGLLQISPKMRFGYSFEHSLNKIAGLNNGTHELSLGVSFGKSLKRIQSPKYF